MQWLQKQVEPKDIIPTTSELLHSYDYGNVIGYIDMLRTIHEGDWDEAMDMKAWARGQGWTGRDMSPKQML